MIPRYFLPALVFITALVPTTLSQDLSSTQEGLVAGSLAQGAQQSWELGTRSLAILSINVSSYNTFNSKQPLPPPSNISSKVEDPLQPVFAIAKSVVSASLESSNISLPRPLFRTGAVGDSASTGTAVLIANWTHQTGLDYGDAAQQQLEFLYSDYVYKTPDGAWSHRPEQLQLWDDFIYMVPPFLAYYGAMTSNKTLLDEAHTQIRLYRQYLRDNTTGLWHHILLGNGTDPGYWSTGHGWAAMGMLRVLSIIQRSEYANAMKSEQGDLAAWVSEIHDGMYPLLDSNSSLFRNYVDNSTDFLDASSTTILAASVYRLSTVWGNSTYISKAEKCRKTIVSNHIDSQGNLNPVVNPDDFVQQGTYSPEGEAFIIEMEAAYRDWKAGGKKGSGGPVANVGLPGVWAVVGLLGFVFW